MSTELPARHAERVRATVLFADVVGFSRLSSRIGAEGAYLAITHLLRLLDGIARKHGGSVDKYLGDKLMAVFGYPIPLEHPARSAAAAALEMRQRVLDYNREAGLPLDLAIHAGINTGDLVGGDIRGPVVREFHVLGDAVNIAARLNAKAPDGEIWVGQPTWEGAREDFVWRDLEPLHLKGKSRPVTAFALERIRGAAPRGRLGFDERAFAELVGRDAELSRLRACAADLATGHGGALLLTGEEGVGKSRMLAALGEAEELDKLGVLQGHALPSERGRAFAAFGPVVASWAGIGPDTDPETGAQRLREVVEERLPDADPNVLPSLARLLDLGAAHEGPWPPGSAASTVDVVHTILAMIASERPLLVAIEDVQWLDPNSVVLLERILPLAAETPIFFLLTGRRGEVTSLLSDLLERALPDLHEQIELGPLGPDAARALATAALGTDADAETTQLVLDRGEGSPARLLLAAFLAPALRSEREQDADRVERTREAERRRAAVVFADVTGFTAMTEKAGAEAAYPVVAACLQILDDAARAHGGTVDHYLGDCVMALFGVPHALEDPPRAALNAAIDMRKRIRAFNRDNDLAHPVDVHTGVATGLGIAGDISGPLIREFAVMGDHVDLADELTHLAEAGEIYVDVETQRATRDVFDFRPGPAAPRHGQDVAVPTFELLSTEPKLHRAKVGAGRQVFSTLVGRDDELAQIRERVAALEGGEGGVVSLIAQAGIGKSRLVDELAKSEEAGRVIWLEGRSLSNGRNLAYHPIADLMRAWAAIDDDDDGLSARAKLDHVVAGVMPDEADETVPLLANLMGVALRDEERERLGGIQGAALEKLIRGAMTLLLRRGSAIRPLVISLEDLHWADLSSIELLESLLRLEADHPILFLNAFRPGFPETSDRILKLVREQHAERHLELELLPLDRDSARQLVKNLFRGGDIPQTTRAAIEARARGNPFYIEEVVRTLVDAGAVEYREGGFHATERLDSVTIPDTVQDAVMARIDRLDLETKSVLQAASVIGGSFHVDVLETVVDGATRLPGILEALEAGEFIVPSDRTAGIEFAFKHPLVQEVTYDAILEANRRALHLDVAGATESRLPETLPGFSAMLAYHYSVGEDADRAEEYLFRAGEEAARVAASSEALHFFQEASALYLRLHGEAGDPAKKARLEKNLATALLNRGRLIDACDHFDRATELLGAPAPRNPVTMFGGLLWNLVRELPKLYLPLLRPRVRPANVQEKELLDLMFTRAIAQSTSNPTRFFVDCVALLRRGAGLDPYSVPDAAAMYSGLVAIFSLGGISFGVSRRFLEIADDLAERGAVDERELYFRTLHFLHHLLEGDWSERHEIESEALEEGLQDGRFWEASTYINLDGVKRVYQGDFPRARERIEELAKIADLYEHELAASARHAVTAYLHVERREFPEALRALELYYDEHREPLFNLLALGTRAKVESLMGEPAAATLERADAVLKEAGRAAPYHASAVRSAHYLADVEALAAHGGSRALYRRLQRSRRAALGAARWVAFRRPEAFRLAGREAWLRGRHDEAMKWWWRGIACCEGLGARPELGRTCQAVGEALAAGHDGRKVFQERDAESWLAAARDLFVELDLAWDLERLSSLQKTGR